MHRPPHRTPFTTTALHSGTPLPAEYERMAREAFTLLGHPDAGVQLDPSLPDEEGVRGTSFFSFVILCAHFASLPLKISLSIVAVCVLCRRFHLPDGHAHTARRQREPTATG